MACFNSSLMPTGGPGDHRQGARRCTRRRTCMILSKCLLKRSRTGKRAFSHIPRSARAVPRPTFVHILSFKTHPAPEGSTTWAALPLTPHTPSLAHRLRSFYHPQRTPEGPFDSVQAGDWVDYARAWPESILEKPNLPQVFFASASV